MTGPRRESRVAGWVATATAGVAFVVVAFSLPIDDFWLSLASGRAIVHGADLSRAIPLTWLPVIPGALNPQWGAQVVLAAVDTLAWALAINALLLAVGMGATLERMRRRASPAAIAIASLLGLAVLSVHLLARAQSFSIALFPTSLLLLDRLRGRWWLPVAYALLTVAWANLHGAFIVGQLAAACAMIGAAWDASRRRDAVLARDAWIYAATLAAAFAAPLVNPVGTKLLGYAYSQGASDLVRQISVEWQPSWPWEPVGLLFWLLALAIVAGRLVRRPGTSTAELLLAAGTGFLAATSIRSIPWFVLAVVPLLAGDVDALLAARPRLAHAIGQPGGWLRRRLAAVLATLAVVAIAFQVVRPALPASIARLTPDAPVAITEALARQIPPGTTARILNEQVWGGYLEWALDGRVIPAIDGRIEIRTRQTWEDYFDLMGGSGNPPQRLSDAGVKWAALFPTRTELIGQLKAAGWTEIFASPEGVLLDRP
jgi:hypothetical protein